MRLSAFLTAHRVFAGLAAAALITCASSASAQAGSQAPPTYPSADVEQPWSFEFAIGFDNSISGNINSSAIGVLNGQNVAVLKNSYEDVYGTGLHMRFGGGYLIDEVSELRATFTLQSLDADLTKMGDIGLSSLFGQYDDYKSFGLDVGFRLYTTGIERTIRPYVEATAGMAFIDEIDVLLVAPTVNLSGNATDFYDRTAAFALGANAGVLWQASNRIGLFSQLGLRWMTGLSEVDNLAGTGLESINDNSARWTVPFLVGIRARF
jgi:hypothetical protein